MSAPDQMDKGPETLGPSGSTLPPTDPTPTPTPREVLRLYSIGLLLSPSHQSDEWLEKQMSAFARNYHAALRGTGPLSAERLAEIETLVTEHYLGLEIGAVVDELLDAYDAQTAALAASRAEGGAIALTMEYADGRIEKRTTRELQRDFLDRLHKAEAEVTALRARVRQIR